MWRTFTGLQTSQVCTGTPFLALLIRPVTGVYLIGSPWGAARLPVEDAEKVEEVEEVEEDFENNFGAAESYWLRFDDTEGE